MTPFANLRNCLLICKRMTSALLTTSAKRFSSDWSEASTLILVAKRDQNDVSDDQFDYRVLMAKRSGKMSFMSNVYVFPGGQLDFDDFSGNWINCFRGHRDSIDISGPRVAMIEKSVTREQLIGSNTLDCNQLLSTDFALRIAAIRETFEETGILITTPNLSNLTNDSIHAYREKLLKTDLKFSDLCNKLSVCPDVWSLYEWSNWLTPVIEKKRFDTMFYMAFIESETSANLDEEELSHFTWCTPKEMLDNYYSSDIILAPPQVYELLRLLNITKYSQLKQFAVDRQLLGLQQLLPKLVYGKENTPAVGEKIKLYLIGPDFMSLLPGDEQYSENVNESNTRNLYHRLLFKDNKLYTKCTIDMPCGHLSPISYKDL